MAVADREKALEVALAQIEKAPGAETVITMPVRLVRRQSVQAIR